MKNIKNFLIEKFNITQNLQKIIANINWLTFERIVKFIFGLTVGVWVARYLGPRDFGKLNFAKSFISLFSFLTTMGLENIFVREIVDKPEKEKELFGTTLFLKMMGTLLLNIIVIFIVLVFQPKTYLIRIYMIILAFGYFFKPFNVIRYWFRSKINSKFAALSTIASLALINILKIIFITREATLLGFVLLVSFNFFLNALFLVLFYHKKSKNLIFNWKVKLDVAKNLLKDCWPLILSGAAVMIHMKIDQVMLGSMIGDEQLGYYSAAVRLKQWSFLAVIISNSVFPVLIKTKDRSEKTYLKRFQWLLDLMFWMGLAIAAVVSFNSGFIIEFLYGSAYSAAAVVLTIQAWNAVFNFFGIVSSKYLIIENLTKISFFRTILGAVINILLNLILIPKYGIVGASISSLIAVSIQSYFSMLLFKKTRRIFFMFLKSLNLSRIFRLLLYNN